MFTFYGMPCVKMGFKEMNNYLTLKEAAATTGKSERQIRRLCNDPKNKEYIQYDEKGRVTIKIDFLQQSYPLLHVPRDKNAAYQSNDIGIGIGIPQVPDDRDIRIALLEQEINHKEALAAEKDKRIEVLERSLLLLDQARPVIAPQAPAEPESAKRKKFLGLF